LSCQHFADAVQRDSGAPLIRDRRELGVRNDPGSAAHHFVRRGARDAPAVLPFVCTTLQNGHMITAY
jgi:hypothetical protein